MILRVLLSALFGLLFLFQVVAAEKDGSGPVEFWLPGYSRQFIKLVDKFKDTIQIVFSGHTHMDDFRVIEAQRTGLVVNKLVPSISLPRFEFEDEGRARRRGRDIRRVQILVIASLLNLFP
jgi:hypothetical protein